MKKINQIMSFNFCSKKHWADERDFIAVTRGSHYFDSVLI